MKNIIFIPNIDLGDGRNNSYINSIKSWNYFCEKHGCELIVWQDLLCPIEQMNICWQRYHLFDILDNNGVEYDQICMVDADTIVHPGCPNFFEETEHKYCGVMNDGCYEWINRSITDFGNALFDKKRIYPWKYINGGFQIVNKKHKPFFNAMLKYFLENQENVLKAIEEIRAGTDQTILNFMLDKEKIDLKILPPCYNLQDPYRKSLLYIHHTNYWPDNLENLKSSGWIYHFNAIPQTPMGRDAKYWMDRVYNELYEN